MSNNITPMQMVAPMASVITAMATMYALSAGFGAYGAAAGFHSWSSPQEELESLNKRIIYLNKDIDRQREAVVGTRRHKQKMMLDNHLTILPSISELRKYPALRITILYLATAERDLDKMEVKLTLMQKRRKELKIALHLKADEQPMPTHYQTSKGYKPSLINDIYKK